MLLFARRGQDDVPQLILAVRGSIFGGEPYLCSGSPRLYYVGFCSEAEGKQQLWGFGVWVRVYCPVGCGWWAGGEAELDASSVAHSHLLLMTHKKGLQLTLGLYLQRYLVALVKSLCGFLLE